MYTYLCAQISCILKSKGPLTRRLAFGQPPAKGKKSCDADSECRLRRPPILTWWPSGTWARQEPELRRMLGFATVQKFVFIGFIQYCVYVWSDSWLFGLCFIVCPPVSTSVWLAGLL